ncbi:hypothetical protein DPMN_090263 [Dreissena polymorpha]|uniref:Uncharacterized protein n=1 Tax=Dreissena polymorpha TaxID=45954 RepID=A0A9D4KXE3_DREPO|nr:hypothetical protein DPMN_090263 [Dreissena polymorpha]
MADIENNGMMEVASHGEINVNNGEKSEISGPIANPGQMGVGDDDDVLGQVLNSQDANFHDSVQLVYSNMEDENETLHNHENGVMLHQATNHVSFITNNDEHGQDNCQLTHDFVTGNGVTVY